MNFIIITMCLLSVLTACNQNWSGTTILLILSLILSFIKEAIDRMDSED